jgi:hypothetical protein
MQFYVRYKKKENIICLIHSNKTNSIDTTMKEETNIFEACHDVG